MLIMEYNIILKQSFTGRRYAIMDKAKVWAAENGIFDGSAAAYQYPDRAKNGGKIMNKRLLSFFLTGTLALHTACGGHTHSASGT